MPSTVFKALSRPNELSRSGGRRRRTAEQERRGIPKDPIHLAERIFRLFSCGVSKNVVIAPTPMSPPKPRTTSTVCLTVAKRVVRLGSARRPRNRTKARIIPICEGSRERPLSGAEETLNIGMLTPRVKQASTLRQPETSLQERPCCRIGAKAAQWYGHDRERGRKEQRRSNEQARSDGRPRRCDQKYAYEHDYPKQPDREADRGTYPALALDHMKPMRPVVDRAVLDLVAKESFTGADFSIQHDGVCRLNPELARRATEYYAAVTNIEWLRPD